MWTLSRGALEKAGVTLGETYPNPVHVAPEWSRHYSKASVSVINQKRLILLSYLVHGVKIKTVTSSMILIIILHILYMYLLFSKSLEGLITTHSDP